MIPILGRDCRFPPASQALAQPNGLLAAGGDLSAGRLLDAYRNGIFPWFSPGDPILWWSPDPRMVLFPTDFKLTASLRKTIKKLEFEVRTDYAFEQVMRSCAAPRKGESGTWIVEDMIDAYLELHRLGCAHSIEIWMKGELVGGLYGVAIGKMFFGESMFSRRTDGSKIAFAHMTRQLERWGFGMIDCQMYTSHLASLGAHEIPRAEFIARLQDLINCEPVKHFQFDTDLF
ncbi:MAG: leucyl/phenylalanyl-tRNA--protein transferase [Gallionellaceae bacterium]|nr:MAG: leucyl/phenylalanyl-tRNA--protein transferase [Gallionellaceae bacterium]